MSVDGVRRWGSHHPFAFAASVWAIPVILLAPLVLLVERPEVVLPMLLAGPVVPAAAGYAAIRSQRRGGY